MSKNFDLSVLSPKTINLIRDIAVKNEAKNLEVATQLMEIANTARPQGEFIASKLTLYKKKLSDSIKIQKMLDNNELLIVPIGFRCHTKMNLKNSLNISLISYPFDNGFFPPQSIVSLLKNPNINLSIEDCKSHNVCMKFENYEDVEDGKGIKFKTSNYDEINNIVENMGGEKVNRYLDSTFGYYTLDNTHNFVLAHYNWHKFANPNKSKGITEPRQNLEIINNTLNRRLKRLLKAISKADKVVFVYGEFQDYKYMKIDDVTYSLSDLSILENYLNRICKNKSFVCTFERINSQEKLLNLIS